MLLPNQHYLLSAKMNGTQRRAHEECCGMPNGTCRAKAMSNSEKIKPVALAVIKLRLSESISQLLIQLLSQSVESSVKYIYFFLNSVAIC